jgi:polysaccharide biosynthesis transport protein
MSTVSPQRSMPSRPGSGGQRPVGPVAASSGAAAIDPIRVVRRYLLWIVASVFVGAGFGVVAFFYLDRFHPSYTADVLFEIQPGLRESRDIAAQQLSDSLTYRLANTETYLLTSRQVLTVAVQARDIQQTQWYQGFMTVDDSGQESFDVQSAVDDLEQSLSASAIRDTNFFRLRWSAPHARDLPTVLNAVTNAYLQRRGEIDNAVWNDNLDVFRRELRNTTRELDRIDIEISQFIRDHGITTLADPRYSELSYSASQLTEQITGLTSAISMTQVAIQQKEAKIRHTIQPSYEDELEAKQDPAVRMFDQQIAALRAEIRNASSRVLPGHHGLNRLEMRLAAVELERQDKLDEVILQNLNASRNRMQSDLERYRQRLEEAQEEAEDVDQRLRELTANHAQYQALEARRNRLEMQRQSDLDTIRSIELIRTRTDAARVRLAQQAEIPRAKSFPRLPIIVPFCTLVFLMGTVGIIFLRELTDQRIKTASDLTILPTARVLGVIPDLAEDPTSARGTRRAELVVRQHPQSVLAESYRQACALMMRAVERNGHQTILFLSGMPGAGTTTAVTNVACSLQAAGQKVLVIDANFRRPGLAKAMGVEDAGERQPGLGDLLVGGADVNDAIVKSEYGVDVIGAGTPANRVFERLHNGLFESIAAELRGMYDVILFDAPPAVVAGDAMILANRVDAAVLVVRANQEQRGLVARLMHQLADARCEHLGIILNRPRGTAGGYFKKNFEAMAKYAK